MQFYHLPRGRPAPAANLPFWGTPGHPKSTKNAFANPGAHRCAKRRTNCAKGRPRCAKVRPKSPKWSQNGGPGPSRNWSCAQTAVKTVNMRSAHYLQCFKEISLSGNPSFLLLLGYSKVMKTGFRTEGVKKTSKLRPRAAQWRPKGSTSCSKAPPDAPQCIQNPPKSRPKMRSCARGLPKGSQRHPRAPKSN